MRRRHPAPVRPGMLADMALVSDLVEAAAAQVAGAVNAGLMHATAQKLEAVPVDRWERVFGLALEVVARRTGDDREQQLRALAEVVAKVGALAGAIEPNEGEQR